MSHAAIRFTPPPTQAPSTSAITGTLHFTITEILFYSSLIILKSKFALRAESIFKSFIIVSSSKAVSFTFNLTIKSCTKHMTFRSQNYSTNIQCSFLINGFKNIYKIQKKLYIH